MTASGGISREQFKPSSLNFTGIVRTTGPTNMPDMTSLAVSSRLQNAIKYGTKVRETGPAGQRVG